MKPKNKSHLLVSLLIISILAFVPKYAFASNADLKLMYKDNSDKKIEAPDANQYYLKNKIGKYHELKNADINIREKTLYAKTFKIIEKKLKNHEFLVRKYNQNKLSHVSPDRQVYFFYTLKVGGDYKIQSKLAIVDVETQDILLEKETIAY
ncbi:hypothetical protein [Bacillus sp. Marseille-Q1617]|uniref:hypothetical protein n=1 Tax=Bacillus sp. Marseille-Q1617 TaxID=2736887 RepID=UPI001589D3FF|nr:hypothetical protein [Bacillus sp. Marseille-Q1617]